MELSSLSLSLLSLMPSPRSSLDCLHLLCLPSLPSGCLLTITKIVVCAVVVVHELSMEISPPRFAAPSLPRLRSTAAFCVLLHFTFYALYAYAARLHALRSLPTRPFHYFPFDGALSRSILFVVIYVATTHTSTAFYFTTLRFCRYFVVPTFLLLDI